MSTHILVVDDDDKIRSKLAYLLHYAGYQVSQASSGEDAIALLATTHYDLVLTDIVMGAIDGIQVLQAARKQHYPPAVVLLTGHGTLTTAITALREGANDYLLKPCPTDLLLSCIKRTLHNHTQEKTIYEAAETFLQLFSKEQGGAQVNEEHMLQEKSTGTLQHDSPTPELVPLCIGELEIGSSRKKVYLSRQPIQLTPIEYKLLRYLANMVGEICHSCDIVRVTHDIDVNDDQAQSLLKTHIRNLRKKIGHSYLVTERGTGYMLVDPQGS